MGEAAGVSADLAIVTSDNPRSEDPVGIILQVEDGLRASRGHRTQVEVDRRRAIARAIAHAPSPATAVLIAGKGHEDYQIFADRTIHFDDREVARRGAGRMLTVTVDRLAHADGRTPRRRVRSARSGNGRRDRLSRRSIRAACSSRCRASTSTVTSSSPRRSARGARAARDRARRSETSQDCATTPRASGAAVDRGRRRARGHPGPRGVPPRRDCTARSSESPARPARPPRRTSLDLGAADAPADVVAT